MKKSFSRKINFCAALFFAAVCVPQQAHAFKTRMAETHETVVTQWLPDDFYTAGKKYPLIVFSHAFSGCANQSSFLTQILADNGYVVIAPNHPDARCKAAAKKETATNTSAQIAGKLTGEIQRALSDKRGYRHSNEVEKSANKPETWGPETEFDRTIDVEHAVDQILDDISIRSRIDKDKIALMGHSLGGYTALGLAGGWPSWRNFRYKAVVALSPYATPYTRRNALSGVIIPTLYIGGTKDVVVTPQLEKRGGAYDQTRGPKYLIVIDGVSHFSFTDAKNKVEDHHELIAAYTIAFFDKYLKDEDDTLIDEAPVAGLANFRAKP